MIMSILKGLNDEFGPKGEKGKTLEGCGWHFSSRLDLVVTGQVLVE